MRCAFVSDAWMRSAMFVFEKTAKRCENDVLLGTSSRPQVIQLFESLSWCLMRSLTVEM